MGELRPEGAHDGQAKALVFVEEGVPHGEVAVAEANSLPDQARRLRVEQPRLSPLRLQNRVRSVERLERTRLQTTQQLR